MANADITFTEFGLVQALNVPVFVRCLFLFAAYLGSSPRLKRAAYLHTPQTLTYPSQTRKTRTNVQEQEGLSEQRGCDR